MRERVQIWADKEFKDNMRKLFPNTRSDFFRTKAISKILEDMLYNKKGSMLDIFYIMVIILGVAFLMIIVVKYLLTFQGIVQTFPGMPADAININDDLTGKVVGNADNLVIFVFFLLCIVMLILAVLIPVHWIFMVVFIMVWIVSIIFGGYMSNAFDMMAEQAYLSDAMAKFPMTTFLFRYFPLIIGLFGLLLAWVMYKFNVYGTSSGY